MKEFNLPKSHKQYIDKYFLRAKEILVKENLNPFVKAQVFIRKGECSVYGLDEAIAILKKYNPNPQNMKIFALQEGDYFKGGECLMTIEAPIQDIIDLETMYLGVLSSETSVDNELAINLADVEDNMRKIVDLVKPRPVSYFGARHWHYKWDNSIARACKRAGATNCSTDAGAKAWGRDSKGIGTIPHALEAIYHWDSCEKLGGVFEATVAFHTHIDKTVPRIALVDYANQEITDSLAIARELGKDLYGIRIDTCGENYMQGIIPSNQLGYHKKYWNDKGVSIYGVYLVRKLLNDSGFGKVKVILSSGFGNPEKVKAFLDAEKILNMKLFDSLGVGGVFESRMATMDIIKVEDKEIHKVGRLPKDTSRLKRVV